MPKEKLPDEKCVTLEDGSCIGEGCMHDPKTPPVRVWTRAELDAEIADRNARFDALTPAARRIAIMRDVIDQIQLNRIKPMKGVYLSDFGASGLGEEGYRPANQRKVDSLEECLACARGAIFVAAVQLFDRLPRGRASVLSQSDAEHLIKDGTFTADQLFSIENAFECWGSGDDAKFGRQFEDVIERLLAIAQNVIDNGGEFIP